MPLKAVKPLARLAELHPDLAIAAVNELVTDKPAWMRAQATWATLEADPIDYVCTELDDLPAGIFALGGEHFINQFALTSDTEAQLGELAGLLGYRREHIVYIDDAMLEQLGAGTRSKDRMSGADSRSRRRQPARKRLDRQVPRRLSQRSRRTGRAR